MLSLSAIWNISVDRALTSPGFSTVHLAGPGQHQFVARDKDGDKDGNKDGNKDGIRMG